MRSPLNRGNQGQLSPDGRSALVAVRAARHRRAGGGRRGARRWRRSRTSRPTTPASSSGSSAGRARAARCRRRWGRLPEGRAPLAADHAADPRCSRSASLVAAGVPLLLGITAVMASLGLVNAPRATSIPMDESITSIILLDRPGRRRRLLALLPAPRARGAAQRRSRSSTPSRRPRRRPGRAVLVSGLTVMIAMAGMFIAGDSTFTSLGLGAIIVVAVAVVGSLTVRPRAARGARRQRRRGRDPVPRHGGWRAARAHSRVLGGGSSARRCAARSSARSPPAACCVVLALPALLDEHGAHRASTTCRAASRSCSVYDRDAGGLPRRPDPGGRRRHREGRAARRRCAAAIADLERRAIASPGFQRARRRHGLARTGTVAQVDLPMAGDGTDAASERALADLRDDARSRRRSAAVDGRQARTSTGIAAGTKDFNDLDESAARRSCSRSC